MPCCFLDDPTLADYILCQSRDSIAVRSFWSRLVRPGFESRAKRSVLDGVFMALSLSGSDPCTDRTLRGTRRRFVFRRSLILLGSLGFLAFLFSAITPKDDAFQQECFRARRSALSLNHQGKRLSQIKRSELIQTVFWPITNPSLVRAHRFVSFLESCSFFDPQTISSSLRAPRPPPAPLLS